MWFLQNLLYLLAYVAVVITIILICRELVTWYWKINKMQQIQENALTQIKTLTALTESNQKIMQQQLNELRRLGVRTKKKSSADEAKWGPKETPGQKAI